MIAQIMNLNYWILLYCNISKLSRFNLLDVDNEFILPNTIVHVIFKLSISNSVCVDKILKLVSYAYVFIPYGVDVNWCYCSLYWIIRIKNNCSHIIIHVRYLL